MNVSLRTFNVFSRPFGEHLEGLLKIKLMYFFLRSNIYRTYIV